MSGKFQNYSFKISQLNSSISVFVRWHWNLLQKTDNCHDAFQYESFELNLNSNIKSKTESLIIQRLPTWYSMGLDYSYSLIFFCECCLYLAKGSFQWLGFV